MEKLTLHQPKYFLNANGEFIIENYNHALPFSNFFPGIAGLWGIPMWAFYVNRGQCMSSFGIEGKDKAILEFHPANRAYQMTSLHGFRTFIKVKSGNEFYEPFQNHSKYKTKHTMAITSHDLTLEEINADLGLKIRVNYFTLPEEPFAALVRTVTIMNISKKKCSLEVIDGLPAISPFGLNDWLLKHMSRTAEAWHQVGNLDKKAPYYNLKVVISDKPHVSHITAGNFYISFQSGRAKSSRLDPIVQPSAIFGQSLNFLVPEHFIAASAFKIPDRQKTDNVTPCAMSFARLELAAQSEKKIFSVFGHIHGQKELNALLPNITTAEYIAEKARRAKEIIDEIKSLSLTSSASKEFDLYAQQTFLDNVMRGGLPVSLDTGEGKVALSVFTRKHGDPERDYNNFVIAPTYLSQGNGNYRDVNQNRRNDPWFNPDVKDSNIINFLSLIQTDGFNPLIIRGTSFVVDDPKRVDAILNDCVEGRDHIRELLEKGFLPGKLLMAATQKGVKLKVSPEEFLKRVLTHGRKAESAEHGEGFWTDHWTYNLDLLESYLALYPENLQDILLDKKVFGFFHNFFHVLPRSQRYVLTMDGCRQYHSVVDGIGQFKGKHDNKLRTQNGSGSVYQTSLIVKLLCVIANKAASFDPSGIGIEMEADRPNWYDALNGLPGRLGSSVSETFELKRLCLFLLYSLNALSLKDNKEIRMFEELHTFILGLKDVLTSEKDVVAFWNKSNDIKEQYRARTLYGINGEEKEISVSIIKDFLKAVVAKAEQAAKSAKDKNGLGATYFTHDIVDFEKSDKHNHDGLAYVKPLAFKKYALPFFLEGFVHELRVEENKERARKLYQAIRRSPLFDRKLKMYKVNADLSGASEEIGRTRVFPRGWLENESIWLHMEYKFLLELLRCGLYKEFFENFSEILVPFLKPEVYGRSILENSSFIASSAHEDPEFHGRGFVARLSGTTAEFVHMWLMVNAGVKPFLLDRQGKLTLEFKPILPGWLFTKKETVITCLGKNKNWLQVVLPKNTYAFNFLGSTLVVYHNPKRQDTFAKKGIRTKRISLTYCDSKKAEIDSAVISSQLARDVRDGKVARIDVFFN